MDRQVTGDSSHTVSTAQRRDVTTFYCFRSESCYNGRLARLLANLPVLRAGEPPVVVDAARRAEYIDILWSCHRAAGPLVPTAGPLVRRNDAFRRFVDFLRPDWDRVRDLCR